LGIPTVTDRIIQQAIAQLLSPIYERKFSDHSYGFRPNRSAHQALKKLSNIVLDELDEELERRGHKFVRFADDGAQRMRDGPT